MIDLQRAVVYDIETFPNAFTLVALGLYDSTDLTFEISDQGRDDRRQLLAWFYHWRDTATPMVGFNNVAFDYPVIHALYDNPYMSAGEIYDRAQEQIAAGRFNIVWPKDRFAPQVDLFKIWHFDNRAKSTSLKALQVSMRSETVLECPLPFDQSVTREQIDHVVVPFNRHDVNETRRFAHISLDAIKFRMDLSETLRGDVLNWNDTKIGGKILEQRLGDDLCYDEQREPRRTVRDSIPLNDIVFPYIQFQHPEFQRILTWMRGQTLTANELTDSIQTKGVFTGVRATVGGLDFHFGTGGIHGSVSNRKVVADENYGIYDIDVEGLYPSIAIVNGLHPEHLGERFVEEYAKLPLERKKHKKGTVENAALKLAANGTYGNSNNQHSVFYDSRFTMTITVNGQLMLAMLAEWLFRVPDLEILQINTDGLTYRCPRYAQPLALMYQRIWERYTQLKLERAEYNRMWIRDVNSYIGEFKE